MTEQERDRDSLSLLKNKEGENAFVWVENLLTEKSVFRDAREGTAYEMESHGYVGSVIEMPAKIARNTFLRRAVSRGKLQLLSEEDAFARQEELVFREESNTALLEQALEEGASEMTRYAKEVSDDGHEQGSIAAKQVWDDQRTVRRSGSAPRIDDTSPGPLSPEEVLTPPVKEGQWVPDTGA